MSEKWYPPKPEFRIADPVRTDKIDDVHPSEWGWDYSKSGYFTRFITESEFNQWYDEHIKTLFENAVEVYAREWRDDGWTFCEKNGPIATHRALLIKIEPLKEETTAEDLLIELINAHDSCGIIEYRGLGPRGMPTGVIERAKRWLERNKKPD